MNDQDRERFLAKINYGGNPRLAGCWLWTASTDSTGYGQFWVDGKVLKAHRVSYKLFSGEIPDGLLVRHTCHNPLCVNPAHLIVGTHQDNMDDKVRAGRQARQKGEAHGSAKLTDSAVREIRDLTGRFRQYKLAEMYGVSQQHISDILNNKKWKETS